MDVEVLQNIPPWDWPEDAGTIFLGLLGDTQATSSHRLLAAELAGDYTVINDDLADALLTIVRSDAETEEMRGTAAISLGPALENADTMGFDDPDESLLSEDVFHHIQQSLHDLFFNTALSQEVRRQILEVSVRAPEAWHPAAVRTAYESNDDAWQLTAVFCMRFIRGFEEQILEVLHSNHPDLHYQAVRAAGNWGMEATWTHIVALLTEAHSDKDLLLAAIEAVANIRPHEAATVLAPFSDSDDEEIADAVFEALLMVDILVEDDEDDDEEIF